MLSAIVRVTFPIDFLLGNCDAHFQTVEFFASRTAFLVLIPVIIVVTGIIQRGFLSRGTDQISLLVMPSHWMSRRRAFDN